MWGTEPNTCVRSFYNIVVIYIVVVYVHTTDSVSTYHHVCYSTLVECLIIREGIEEAIGPGAGSEAVTGAKVRKKTRGIQEEHNGLKCFREPCRQEASLHESIDHHDKEDGKPQKAMGLNPCRLRSQVDVVMGS